MLFLVKFSKIYNKITAKMGNENKMIQIGPAAKHLGVSRDTLRRWEKKGKLKSVRSPSNRRYYTKSQLDELMSGKREALEKANKPKKALKIGKTGQLFTFGIISFIIAALLALLLQFFLLK